MGDLKVQAEKNDQEVTVDKAGPGERLNWKTPLMEDVSDQVMAQPYIRFT